MIQKGIIESIISLYEYKVRIPRYDKVLTTPGAVKTSDLSSAVVCSYPGTKVAFQEGDIVLVGFENDELNKPIILGLLYRNIEVNNTQINLPEVHDNLNKIEKNLDILNKSNLYTHIKYSNDNGVTFTSLYEYADTSFTYASQSTYVIAKDIVINSRSSIIYWSIINSKNEDVTSKVSISTTLYSDDNDLTETFNDSLIYIPLKFKGLKNLKLSFRILYTKEFDDYHVVLTTDKDTIGSVYGDYIGICVSSNPIPPVTLSSYSWTSLQNSIKYFVDKLENLLLPRVERNEQALYGFNYSSESQVSDGTGLLDGISISKNDIDIHGAGNKNIFFNTNNSMYIDNKNDNLTLVNIRHTKKGSETMFFEFYGEDGHLKLLTQTIGK